MKKPLVVLLLAALVVPSVISLAATNEANITPDEQESVSIEETWEIKEMTFAEAKLYAQQLEGYEKDILLALLYQLETYNISYNSATKIILMHNGVQTINSTNTTCGEWRTDGYGYGWPPGITTVEPLEIKLLGWCYPDDENAYTKLWAITLPNNPIIYRGPHAGGVAAICPSFLRAPTILEGPGIVWGMGAFLIGVCVSI